MISGLARAGFKTTHPHVRQIEPWRDGRQLASLLESTFAEETFDESGHRLIHMLRNYGQFEPMTFGFGTGFVWVEDDKLLGNASVQRNPMRRDTWIIGNVAVESSQRNRGIGQAVIESCIRYAESKRAKHIALQVEKDNPAGQRLYQKAGFTTLGEVVYYLRASVRQAPIDSHDSRCANGVVRGSKWRDRNAVWQITRENIPDELTYAEPFDDHVYLLGFRWSLMNSLNGNPEKWWVSECDGGVIGAARTRANIEGANHHVELMLSSEATTHDGVALLEEALRRFEPYISKPVYAAQSRPREASHAALQAMGFKPARNLVHMRLDL
jgi:GNAT superfamily N-acetyltransferase